MEKAKPGDDFMDDLMRVENLHNLKRDTFFLKNHNFIASGKLFIQFPDIPVISHSICSDDDDLNDSIQKEIIVKEPHTRPKKTYSLSK